MLGGAACLRRSASARRGRLRARSWLTSCPRSSSHSTLFAVGDHAIRQASLTTVIRSRHTDLMSTPEFLEGKFTLLTAAARLEQLRVREALAPTAGEVDESPAGEGNEAMGPAAGSLNCEDALELLALSEVLARKASYGRQLSVRSARAAGASWSRIGGALGISKQAAWEAHSQWIDDQVEQHRRSGYEGMDTDASAAARTLAGTSETN